MAYCTVTEVKQYANINEAVDDAIIAELIDRVTLAMDAAARRTLVTATDTDRYFTVGRDTEGYTLYFDDVCASVTTVLNGDASATEVTSAQYALLERNYPPYYGIRILSSAGKVWEYNNDPEDAIKVTGKWAYYSAAALPTNVPDDIRQICIKWTAARYRGRSHTGEGDRPLLTDMGVTIMPGGMPREVAEDMRPYIRRGR